MSLLISSDKTIAAGMFYKSKDKSLTRPPYPETSIKKIMTSKITYRILHDIADFQQVFDLEVSVWNMTPGEATSTDITSAITHNGGMLIGAEADGKIIGFTLGFIARHDNKFLIWSHAAGVNKDYQGHGIGYQLKQEQRKWAIEQGYDTICWTFDPMQRGNANFNLRRLGAISNKYLLDVYGIMTDELNAGMRSDRFQVTWNLHDERVIALAEGHAVAPPVNDYPKDAFMLHVDDNEIITQPINSDLQWCFAEIPYKFKELKKSNMKTAQQWQIALSETMLSAFAAGYSAVDFVRHNGRCWYVLEKR
jgi:predicted GNAT superfamily acetyltransferase